MLSIHLVGGIGGRFAQFTMYIDALYIYVYMRGVACVCVTWKIAETLVYFGIRSKRFAQTL